MAHRKFLKVWKSFFKKFPKKGENMEEKINGEQPMENETNVQREIVENEDKGTTWSEEEVGSLGKFKDAESMLKAYNNLQAEFTKKCQKLSEVSKKLEEIEAEQIKAEAKPPVYLEENWEENVSAFLEQNAEAKEFKAQIASEILKDKKLQALPNALELAWARVMKREYASPKKLAEDDDFINNQILSQKQVQERVLNEYFRAIQANKTPSVIAKSGVVAKSVSQSPTSMQEAKQLVQKLFNVKG